MPLQHQYKIILITVLLCATWRHSVAQSVYQPYSYQFYQKLDNDLYNTNTSVHTAIKSYFINDSLIKVKYDSLINHTSKFTGKNGWETSRLFNGHQLAVAGKGYNFYGDFLPDAEVGRDFSNHNTVWTTSLGYQLGGNIGNKFSFYGSFYVNRAQFPGYIQNEINSTYYIPGDGRDQDPGKAIKTWNNSTFLLSYNPVKFVDFELGKDKNFIGDGYRSMLLSDFATNYPFLKATVTLGNVRYMAMYAYLDNPNAPKVPGSNDTRNKWGYFQYVDWNVSNRLSIGFFQNVMAATEDATGNKRGFDVGLASPFIFLTTMNNSENDPDKNLLGFTGKYKLFNKTIIYGQFALNEFRAKDFFSSDGSYTNKYGIQLGFRGSDLFKVAGLNYLAEYNSARPYTYSSFDQTSNYSQNDQPLANPFGANFHEWIGMLNYSAGRFDFQGEVDYADFGLDLNGLDYGQNISRPYTEVVNTFGNYIGQGLHTNFYYVQGKVSYLINPSYNLRFEIGLLYRDEKNIQFNNKTNMITVGLKSSFRDIYTDF